MTQAMVTFVAPLALAKLKEAGDAIDILGNPANAAVRDALALAPNDENGTHFASLHAIQSPDGTRAYIVFEFSADGTDEEATARIVKAVGPMLNHVFMLSSDWSLGPILVLILRPTRSHSTTDSSAIQG